MSLNSFITELTTPAEPAPASVAMIDRARDAGAAMGSPPLLQPVDTRALPPARDNQSPCTGALHTKRRLQTVHRNKINALWLRRRSEARVVSTRGAA